MHASVEPDSPHYSKSHAERGYVLLDGRRLELCKEAHEEEGWAVVLRTDLWDGNGDALPRETLRGRVEIGLRK